MKRLHTILSSIVLLSLLISCAPGDIDIPLYDDIRTPVTALKIGSTNPPKEVSYKGTLVLGFEDKPLAQEEIAFFSVQLPHTYREGTNLDAHIHWVAQDNTLGNVVWEFTHTWTNINGTFPLQTTTTVITPTSGVTDKQIVSDLVSLNGTGKLISSMLLCSLKRNSSNILDTYNGKEAYLLEVDFHYQVNTLGSRSETTK